MMNGPGTSPLSILWRSASVLPGSEPVSRTRTTPYDVSIARRPSVRRAAGAVAAPDHTGCVKWTWLFQKPAVIVAPVQSSTSAFGGTRTLSRPPTAVMAPSRRTTTPSEIAGASGATWTRPPTSTVVASGASGPLPGVVPHPTTIGLSRSAARARLIDNVMMTAIVVARDDGRNRPAS